MSSELLNEVNERDTSALVALENTTESKRELEDAISVAGRLRARFRRWEDGQHAELYSILQEMFSFGLRLEHDLSAYSIVVQQDYFRNNPPRPKKVTSMKAAVFSTMMPTTENAKDRARKFTKILELFQSYKLEERSVIEMIERCGGVESILGNLSKAAKAKERASDGRDGIKLTSAASLEVERDDESPADATAPSELTGTDEVRAPDQALHDALTNRGPSNVTRKTRAAVPFDPSKHIAVYVDEFYMREIFQAVRETLSPKTYAMNVTVYPPDENGIFPVSGVFEKYTEDASRQDDFMGKVGAPNDTAALTDDEIMEPPAMIPIPIRGDNCPRAETAGGAPPQGKPASKPILSTPASPAQMAQPAVVAKPASSENLNTAKVPKGIWQPVTDTSKVRPPITVGSGRNLNKVNLEYAFSQRGRTPAGA